MEAGNTKTRWGRLATARFDRPIRVRPAWKRRGPCEAPQAGAATYPGVRAEPDFKEEPTRQASHRMGGHAASRAQADRASLPEILSFTLSAFGKASMDTSAHLSPGAAAGRRNREFSLGRRLGAIAARIAAWAVARADRLATEVICRELSKLSDAELRGRGLSRAKLAHDVRAGIADRKRG